MSLLVTGSIGIDTVKTPFGTHEDCIGGSAIYFSMAAGFLAPVRFVGAVGGDCPFDLKKIFEGKNVDLQGLEVRKNSKTFRWHGTYQDNMNIRTTDLVELNVLAEAPPTLPETFRDSPFVFLANTAPNLQLQLFEQVQNPTLAVADTMNLWIENEKPALLNLLKKIDGLVLNDSEAILLSKHHNLITAAKHILTLGPRFVVIKKGEHGTLLVTKDNECFALPAYPTENVKDPTGAGDAFAGGMMAYLATQENHNLEQLKKALAYGTVIASLVIEDFSINSLVSATRDDIEKRYRHFKNMLVI